MPYSGLTDEELETTRVNIVAAQAKDFSTLKSKKIRANIQTQLI